MAEPRECIFCRIVAGEIPCHKVYEDDHVLAFLDIGPVSNGHTLVVPKVHCESLDTCATAVLGRVMDVLGRIAKAILAATNAQGYNILCNNGRAAGQLVDHVHFHIIPRNSGDGVFDRWPKFQYAPGVAEAMAASIGRCL